MCTHSTLVEDDDGRVYCRDCGYYLDELDGSGWGVAGT
jgi:hypothetical protein